MPINKLINPYEVVDEDINLIKDVMQELHEVYGTEIWYMPRKAVNDVDLLGEDTLAFYDTSVQMEALPLNIDTNEGAGDVITKFGLDVQDEATFQVMQHRWKEEQTPGLYTESGVALVIEQTANTVSDQDSIKLNIGANEKWDYTLPDRPMEGDLIYHPMTKKLWVINFVEHEKNFYPLGKLLTYQMHCNLFDYSSERIDTPELIINQIANNNSTDIIDSSKSIITESGQALMTEDEEVLMIGEVTVDEIIKFANNQLIQTEADEDMVWDEYSPLLVDKRKY